MTNERTSDAYGLIVYACADGRDREVFWNARVGKAPEVVPSAQTGAIMRRVHDASLRSAYAHAPKIGARIFVPFTEVRLRQEAAELVDFTEKHLPDGGAGIQNIFPTRQAAIASAFESLKRVALAHDAADILVVTHGYLEQLEVSRGGDRIGTSQGRVAEERRFAPHVYDRACQPISWKRWDELTSDEAYRMVAQDVIGDVLVSTCWLGIDHSFGGRVPLIFETMAFARAHQPLPDSYEFDKPLMQERYATEAEALSGHDETVGAFKAQQTAKGTA
jgi:hypothetical protein